MKPYITIKVEGKDDLKILDQLFATNSKFDIAGSKRQVRKSVEKDDTCCGVVDRDFDDDETVERSRMEGARCAILKRYSLENYLIDPTYLFQLAQSLHADQHENWSSVEKIRNLIIRRGREMCHYTAANELLHSISRMVSYQKLTPYLNGYPIIQYEEVRRELQNRCNGLPTSDNVEMFIKQWESRSKEIEQDCGTLDGVNRWINGKVLLRDVLYRDFLEAQPEFHKEKKEEFPQRLTGIAKQNPPAELVDILHGFGVKIIGL